MESSQRIEIIKQIVKRRNKPEVFSGRAKKEIKDIAAEEETLLEILDAGF